MRLGHCPVSVSDILPQSKFMTALVSSIKYVLNRPAVSVGSEHTKNLCLNSLLSNSKETDSRPVISRASPVKPHGFIFVTFTSLLDTPNCNFGTLEPVSNISLLIIPSIVTDRGGTAFQQYRNVGVMTALPGAQRWKELSFTHSRCFPNSVLPSEFHACLQVRVYFQGSVNASNILSGSFCRRVEIFYLSFKYRCALPSEVPYIFAFVKA